MTIAREQETNVPETGHRRLFLKDSSRSFVALGSGKIIMFLAGIILARLLGATDLGVFTLVVTIAITTSSVSLFGIPQATTQRLASESHDALTTAFTSFVIVSVFSVVASVGLLMGSSWIAIEFYKTPALATFLPIASLYVFLNCLHQMLLSVLQGLHSIKEHNLVTVISSIAYLACLSLGAYTHGLVGAVWANSLYLAIGLPAALFLILRVQDKSVAQALRFSIRSQRPILRFAGFLTAGSIIAVFAQWYGPTLLVQRHDYDALGFFRVANMLSANLMMIPLAVSIPLFPSLAKFHATDRQQFTTLASDSFRLVTLVTFPIALILCLFSTEVLTLFYGETFSGASDLLVIMSAAGFLMAINNNAGSLFYGAGEMFASMVLNGVWGLSFCVLGVLLIPPLSGIGLALSFLGSYALMTVIQLTYQRAKWGILFPRVQLWAIGMTAVFFLSYLITTVIDGWLRAAVAVVTLSAILTVELRVLRPGERELLRKWFGRSGVRKGKWI